MSETLLYVFASHQQAGRQVQTRRDAPFEAYP